MDKPRLTAVLPLAAALSMAGCSSPATRADAGDLAASLHLVTPIAATRHVGDDDLLTAGLGAAGLRSPVPPALADAAHPTTTELRRRAIWANWRGIADFAPGGGYGEVYGFVAPVPGREFQALAKLPGARQPHRVLVQLPDAFDPAHPCVVVTASSGSRGVYGAIALAGSWGLSKHCAVAYTDKGTGTGYVDTAAADGTLLDGTRGAPGSGVVEFDAAHAGADLAPGMAPIATKHAHSGDNPEADWGRHVQQAAAFALRVLGEAYPGQRIERGNTRIIAVGVSNGGGAVLRAAELPGDWLDAVVAVSPNVLPAEGGRALYDYTTEAALFAPCALDAPAFDAVALARPGGKASPAGAARCASLQAVGLLPAGSVQDGARAAHAHLKAQGWSDGGIAAAALSTAFDLFRAVAVTYASAYTRSSADAMPCGYSFGVVGADGVPRATTAAERSLWWSDGSGIPPGAGIAVIDGRAMVSKSAVAAADPTFAGLRCLRALWDDPREAGHRALHAGIDATRAALPRAGLPVLVMHGADDGLVPEPFSGGAYARWAKGAGRNVRYWRVANAQHFDAFLGLPPLASRYVPMLAYAYRGLDRMWAHLDGGAPLPADADIASVPREATSAGIAPLATRHLGKLP